MSRDVNEAREQVMGKSIPGTGNSKCKGPMMGPGLCAWATVRSTW